MWLNLFMSSLIILIIERRRNQLTRLISDVIVDIAIITSPRETRNLGRIELSPIRLGNALKNARSLSISALSDEESGRFGYIPKIEDERGHENRHAHVHEIIVFGGGSKRQHDELAHNICIIEGVRGQEAVSRPDEFNRQHHAYYIDVWEDTVQ